MNLDNPIRMVRELKGAPLSILFALSVVRQRVSQAWLERTTGYTDKTIAQAIGYLEEIGLADHTSAGWQLTGAAKQLPLPLGEIESQSHRDDPEEIQENNSDDISQTRRISDPSIIIINTDSEIEELSNNNNKGGRKNSDSAKKTVFQALTKAGIWGKKRESLSKSAQLTVESVENWERELKRQKGMDYLPGLLIRALEGGEAPPVHQEKESYREELIRLGLMCEICGNSIQDCECEEEENET